ncbi:hypothetical protein FACS1894217_15050 [Clostridia bacterium]|nr:hypothetical protein FACS1894217_15050 [Clostridia bacterium]
MKRFISFVTAAALSVSLFAIPVADAATGKTRDDYEEILNGYSVDPTIPNYKDYAAAHPDVKPDQEIIIDAQTGNADYVDYEGMPGASQLIPEDGLAEYDFTVSQEGYYDLGLTYYPIEGKGAELQRSIFLDGELPYRELALVQFPRVWQNKEAYGKTGVVTLEWERDLDDSKRRVPLVRAHGVRRARAADLCLGACVVHYSLRHGLVRPG